MPPATALLMHGGGPTPVINASLAGLVEEARRRPEIQRLLGVRRGTTGLAEEDFVDLLAQPPELLDRVSRTPASALGSSRGGLKAADLERILELFRRHGVRWFFCNGGNGTMHAAAQLARAVRNAGADVQVTGIPKTIDNDILGTDHTPGYPTCGRFFAHAVRDIGMDLRSLPGRVSFIETLGRNAGWIAAATALARCAEDDPPHLIYLPERPVSEDRICADVERVYRRLGWCAVVVCEGLLNERGEAFGADLSAPDGFSRQLARNLAHSLAETVGRRTGLRCRSEKPGLLGRATSVHVAELDWEEARECGRAAVEAALAGCGGQMIALRREPGPQYHCRTALADLAVAANAERLLPPEWISPEGNDVAPAFLAWARPLVGEVPPHPRLA